VLKKITEYCAKRAYINYKYPLLEFQKELEKHKLDSNSIPVKVLDLGFGSGGHFIKPLVHYSNVPIIIDVVDIKKIDTISLKKKLNEYGWNVVEINSINGKIPQILENIQNESYDYVLCFDMIEHIPKHDGYFLIYEALRVGKSLFLFTPNGFVFQSPDPDNIFNMHVSGWTYRDIKETLPNEIFGKMGFKFTHGVYGHLKVKVHSAFVNQLLLTFLSTVCKYSPKFAFSLLAIYRSKKSL
jgi:2-polyprenyl-3-methyl-5-hydroxy-6-metoxy-1,4-benzoquinol methylase